MPEVYLPQKCMHFPRVHQIHKLFLFTLLTLGTQALAWTSTGSLPGIKISSASTRMADGRVLSTGGINNNNDRLKTAYVYDKGANGWTAVPDMSVTRLSHTSTLLANGKVLIAAGEQYDGLELKSAELFDPKPNTWSTVASLNEERSGHTATLLPDGRVLVLGGFHNGPRLRSAEIYDPKANTWTKVDNVLISARNSHTATLLRDGSVLVVGGINSTGWLQSAERCTINANTVNCTSAGSLSHARSNTHTATLLNDGRVFVYGVVKTGEIFNPVNNTWSSTTDSVSVRYNASATLLTSGKVLIAGGYNGPSQFSYDSAEEYDPVANTWSAAAGTMSSGRRNHIAVLLASGQVLFAGGTASYTSFPVTSELYGTATGLTTWTGNFRPRFDGTVPSLRRFLKVDAGGAQEGGQRTHPCLQTIGKLPDYGNCKTDPYTDEALNKNGPFCPAGDTHCRFILNPDSDGYELKVTTKAGDVRTDSGQSNPRNELEQPLETLDENSRSEIIEGDDRYYAWQTRIPSATSGPNSFPEPGTGPNWHVTFQFHEVGICSGGSPVLTFGLNPFTTGGVRRYQWLLKSKETYSLTDSDELWHGTESQGIARDTWYTFILHVKWSRDACTNCGTAPAVNPNGGVIELWVNGSRVVSTSKKTMYAWPSKEAGVVSNVYGNDSSKPGTSCQNCDCSSGSCSCEYPAAWSSSKIGEFMPNVLKTGLYRDGTIADPETLFQRRYAIGMTCAAVGGSCP